MDYDIVISGGGIAGLTAAAGFASAGFSTLIVDPPPPVTEREAEGADLRTTAFLQPAQSFLEEIGLWPRLAAATPEPGPAGNPAHAGTAAAFCT